MLPCLFHEYSQNKPKRISFSIFFYVLFDRTKSIVTYKNDWNWLVLTVSRGYRQKGFNAVGRMSIRVATYSYHSISQHHIKNISQFPLIPLRNLSHCMCVCVSVCWYNKCIFCRFYIIYRINSIFIYIQFCVIPLWSCSTNVHEIVTLVTVH